MTPERYRDQLLSLLPRGAAWVREFGSHIAFMCLAMGDELSRVHLRVLDLVTEAIPSETNELLVDWERVTGIPEDDCMPQGETLQQRRQAVLSKLVDIGGQSAAYFITVAETVGYTVTIVTYLEAKAGRLRCGDRLTNGDWKFVWSVQADGVQVTRFRAGQSRAGERLRVSSAELLECVLGRMAPSHTILLFDYGES